FESGDQLSGRQTGIGDRTPLQGVDGDRRDPDDQGSAYRAGQKIGERENESTMLVWSSQSSGGKRARSRNTQSTRCHRQDLLDRYLWLRSASVRWLYSDNGKRGYSRA